MWCVCEKAETGEAGPKRKNPLRTVNIQPGDTRTTREKLGAVNDKERAARPISAPCLTAECYQCTVQGGTRKARRSDKNLQFKDAFISGLTDQRQNARVVRRLLGLVAVLPQHRTVNDMQHCNSSRTTRSTYRTGEVVQWVPDTGAAWSVLGSSLPRQRRELAESRLAAERMK